MTSLYAQRCNDPAAREEWRNSGLVNILTLRCGDLFESVDGQKYRYQRQTASGSVLVTAAGCSSDEWFTGCADVRPIKEWRP